MEKRTSYDYVFTGGEGPVTVTVEAGKGGVKQVHIDVLTGDTHRWYLQDRYQEENADKVFRAKGDEYGTEDITDINSNVHDMAFPEKKDVDPRIPKLLEAMKELTPQQVDLVYEIYGMNRGLSEIAEAEGVSRQAINNRMNKVINRLKKLMETEE